MRLRASKWVYMRIIFSVQLFSIGIKNEIIFKSNSLLVACMCWFIRRPSKGLQINVLNLLDYKEKNIIEPTKFWSCIYNYRTNLIIIQN